MVDPPQPGAALEVVPLEQSLGGLHRAEVLDREPQLIKNAQRAALAGLDAGVEPAWRPAARLVVPRREVEVLVGADEKSDVRDGGSRRPPEDQAMVMAVLVATQVEGIFRLLGHDETQLALVELARAADVGHEQLDVPDPHDVEWGGPPRPGQRLGIVRPHRPPCSRARRVRRSRAA
jgi:hypothetical protein